MSRGRKKGELEVQLERKLQTQGRKKSTIDAYCRWYRRYVRDIYREYGRFIHPRELREDAFEDWLTGLACDSHVAPSTQNQAFAAICCLYREVLGQPLENVNALRAKGNTTVRTILDQSEIEVLFSALSGVPKTVAMLMYGCGFRIGEMGLLRTKDFCFDRGQITIHCAKGGVSRTVQFPSSLHAPVQRLIDSARVLWKADVADGMSGVSLPYAYGRKRPASRLDFAWYYFLPADNYSRSPDDGRVYRHHRDTAHIGKQITKAFHKTGIAKKFSPHTLRHCFATHLLELGTPIHYLQQLLGHRSIETTQLYLHSCKDRATAQRSPIDFLDMRAEQPRPAEVGLAEHLERPRRTATGRPKLRVVG